MPGSADFYGAWRSFLGCGIAASGEGLRHPAPACAIIGATEVDPQPPLPLTVVGSPVVLLQRKNETLNENFLRSLSVRSLEEQPREAKLHRTNPRPGPC